MSAAVYRFLGSFQTAVNPQLIKEYAQGNVMGMMGLAYRGMKFSFFLLLFIAYPLVLEMDFILSRWLGTVPELAPAFCRLVVANALLDILSSLFATLAKAYGKIRNYQIVVSLTLFLNFPLSNGLALNTDLNISLGQAVCLITAPSGARFPLSTAILPSVPIALSYERIISYLVIFILYLLLNS